MEISGIGAQRLHLAWVSSAEAGRFTEVVTNVTESVRAQGKFDPQAFALELEAAEIAMSREFLRWMVGKETSIIKKGDVYGRLWDAEKFESALDSVLEREYHKCLILCAIKQGSTSVRAISERTGINLGRISYLLADMEKTSMVTFKGMENKIPVFAAL